MICLCVCVCVCVCVPSCRRCAGDGPDGVVAGFAFGHFGHPELREKMAWPGRDPRWFKGIDGNLNVLFGLIWLMMRYMDCMDCNVPPDENDVEVSLNGGTPESSIDRTQRIFHYKPTMLGSPPFMEPLL